MEATESVDGATPFPALALNEELLTDKAELVWRQIHPRFFQKGIIASAAFNASEKDERKLSNSRELKVTAEQAFQFHTVNRGRESVGTGALDVGEVIEAGSRVVDDEAAQQSEPATPGHCYIDFRNMSKSQRSDLREMLAELATERGLVYQPS